MDYNFITFEKNDFRILNQFEIYSSIAIQHRFNRFEIG